MRAIISFFISLLFSFFIVFFTNITSTLAFRELAVAHGVSITFTLVFLAIVTISFAVILLLYSLSRLVIDSATNEIITCIELNNKSIKDAVLQSIVEKYTSLFNRVETLKVYNKNTISLINNSHDTLEHKLDKLLALSDSPANQLPVDRLVLSKHLVMKLVQDVYEDDDIVLYKGVEVTVTAVHLDKTYDSGIVYETSKGLLDMGLLGK